MKWELQELWDDYSMLFLLSLDVVKTLMMLLCWCFYIKRICEERVVSLGSGFSNRCDCQCSWIVLHASSMLCALDVYAQPWGTSLGFSLKSANVGGWKWHMGRSIMIQILILRICTWSLPTLSSLWRQWSVLLNSQVNQFEKIRQASEQGPYWPKSEN